MAHLLVGKLDALRPYCIRCSGVGYTRKAKVNEQGQDIGEGECRITSGSCHPRRNHRNAAKSNTDHTCRPQPSSVGYAAEAHQGIAGEGNRTQERGGRAYYLVEQGSKMVPSNKGYAQSRKGVPCRRFQPRADGGTDDGQAP